MVLDKIPDEATFDVSILMNQDVALGHNPSPGDLWMRLSELGGDPVRCFADDLNRPLDRELEHPICRIVVEGQVFGEQENLSRSLQQCPRDSWSPADQAA